MIDEPLRERGFGPDERERGFLATRQRREPGDVGLGNRNATPDLGEPRVSRRRKEFERRVVAEELPPERVLACPPADDQNFHRWPPLNASSNAPLARSITSPSLPTAARAWSP